MKKQNRVISFLINFSLLISLATIIPFNFKSIENYEWMIKFCIYPLIILVISIFALVQRTKKIGNNKYELLGTTHPITVYISSSFMFLATLALRTGTGEWVDNLTAYIILAVCGLLLTLLLVLGKFNDKSKLTCIGSSVLLIIALVGTAVYSAFNAYSFVGIDCSKDYETVFLTAFVCAFIIIILLNLLFFFAQKAILNEVKEEMDMDKYELYRKDYLLNMYSFAKEQLELAGYEFPEGGETKIIEVPVEVPVEIPVEVQVEKPKAPKPPKEKKIIEPSVAQLAEYIKAEFSDAEIVYGKTEDNYKVFRNKKLMCIIQSSANDYKIIFQRKPISLAKLLIKYPNIIVKANSPKGEQWFKAINKGDISEDDLKIFIKFSHKYLVDEEAKAIAKKEKAKAKIQAKKDAIKAKEKAKKDAIKERERAKAQAIKDKEKAKIQAEKDKERAKIQAEKEKEKARIQAEKEKERAKAQALKEKEKEKARIQAEKEKERAKAQALKEKEKAQALKEKEKAEAAANK